MSKAVSVNIHHWPKMVFSWPTAVCAVGAGATGMLYPQHNLLATKIFLFVFAVNLMVLSFEFCRNTSLSFALATLAGSAGLLLLNQRYGLIEPLQRLIAQLRFYASPHFYFAMAGIYFVMYIGMFIATRFDYWQLTGNELIHRTGILGDLERFSTAGLKLNKEIHDVFEYLIGGAGRIIMVIPGQSRPVVLENVIGIKKIEKMADELLNARVVRIETHPDSDQHAGGIG